MAARGSSSRSKTEDREEREREKGKSGCLFRENPTPERKKRTQDGEAGFIPEMVLIASKQWDLINLSRVCQFKHCD